MSSRRSGNRLRLLALGVSLAAVAACGTSGPSRPADRSGPEPAAAVAAPAGGAARGQADAIAAAPPIEVPEPAVTAFSRALAAMASGDWIQAQIEFEGLTHEYPSFPGPYVNLAILYRRDHRDEEAETALNQALAIAPEHPAANNEIGVLYRERGEFAAAEAAYRRALEADPGYALAHYNLGVLLDLYLKREAEALEQYEAYQSLMPAADEEVGRWILDLRRRLDLPAQTQQVAQENR